MRTADRLAQAAYEKLSTMGLIRFSEFAAQYGLSPGQLHEAYLREAARRAKKARQRS